MDNIENKSEEGKKEISNFLKQLNDVINTGDPSKGEDAIKLVNEIHDKSNSLSYEKIISNNKVNDHTDIKEEEKIDLNDELELSKYIATCYDNIETMVSLHNKKLREKISEVESLKLTYEKRYGKKYGDNI
mgnify:CR=1 FL=1